MARNVSKPQTGAGRQHDIDRDMGPFGPNFREPTQKELQMPGDRPFMVERPLPEDRWPRGYTPGRKREVEEALPDISFEAITKGDLPPREYIEAADNAMWRDVIDARTSRFSQIVGRGDPSRSYRDFMRDMHRAKQARTVHDPIKIQSNRARLALQSLATSSLTDTLARSSISPEEITGTGSRGKLRRISADLDLPIRARNHPKAGGWAGLFESGAPAVHLRYPTRNNSSQQIVLHELGHANDPLFDSAVARNRVGSVALAADREGFAEGFTYKHLRFDPRDPSVAAPSVYLGTKYGDIRELTADPQNHWGEDTPDFIAGYLRGYGNNHGLQLGDSKRDFDGPLFSDEDDTTPADPAPPKRSRQDFEVMQLPGLEDDTHAPYRSAMGSPQFSRQVPQSTINPLKGYVPPKPPPVLLQVLGEDGEWK